MNVIAILVLLGSCHSHKIGEEFDAVVLSDKKCDPSAPYRSIDGTCNNLKSESFGSAGSLYGRLLPPDYDDGVGSSRNLSHVGENQTLPGVRLISSTVSKPPNPPTSNYVSVITMQWGQMVAHELSLTADVHTHGCCRDGLTYTADESCQPINVTGDAFYEKIGVRCIMFFRSQFQNTTKGYREQKNVNTAFIDASIVYGSNSETEAMVRADIGPLLKTSKTSEEGGTCPTDYCKNDLAFLLIGETGDSVAGDGRVDFTPGINSIQDLLTNLHNDWATKIKTSNPNLDDEVVYQEARRLVTAVMQCIHYNEFLPVVIGSDKMDKDGIHVQKHGYSTDYDEDIHPEIYNSFASAAMRFGHSLVVNNYRGADNTSFSLRHSFLKPLKVREEKSHPSTILSNMAQTPANKADLFFASAIRNYLFTSARKNFMHGLDLFAITIQRGRDHGIPSYNEWRKFCALPSFNSFADLHGHLRDENIEAIQTLYESVEDIDLYVGGLAEISNSGTVGPTFSCIISRQFTALKKGDRFWFENQHQPKPFTLEQLDIIRKTTFASLLCHYTKINMTNPNSFLIPGPGNEVRKCDEIDVGTLQTTLHTEVWSGKAENTGTLKTAKVSSNIFFNIKTKLLFTGDAPTVLVPWV